MTNKLRVFISSTMKDLRNERQQVIDRLTFLGLEPVYAEAFSPDGGTSWEVIDPKLQGCHLFVLILGESYGWVPNSGYGGEQNKSVTHLEYDAARKLNIPVLPFMKRLEYGAEAEKLRDDFRNEVAGWDKGHFRGEFELATDLADKVARAVTEVLMESASKELLRRRDAQLTAQQGTVAVAKDAIHVQANDRWVLIAGAGLSVSAGYPTANLIISSLAARLWPEITASEVFTRYSFDEVAGYYESLWGHDALLEAIKALLDTPQRVLPTEAHFEAVKKFKTIITTNYDELFEMACLTSGIPYVVTTPTQPKPAEKDKLTIIKMSGTISDLSSLKLTSSELGDVIDDHEFYALIEQSVVDRNVVIVGHGLRDAHVIKALNATGLSRRGIYVRPSFSPMDDIVLKRFNLEAKSQHADEFLRQFQP
ncbi:DUF4062 domain-containing protein [Kosakonia sp. H02]|nr:DUF4062 domain-containing protein [Kosakonia sp. H02]